MPTYRDKEKLAEKLRDEEAFATSLLAIVLDEYGTESLSWDPETLWLNLEEDYGADLPPVNRDKLQALVTVYTTDLFYRSPELFAEVCNVLSGAEADFVNGAVLTPEEVLWGLYETQLNVGLERSADEPPPEFTDEVRRYIGVVLAADGMTEGPDLLRLAIFPERAAGMEQWTGDPEIFNALYDLGKDRRQELLVYTGQRLLDLLQELDELPLRHRNQNWKQFQELAAKQAHRLLGTPDPREEGPPGPRIAPRDTGGDSNRGGLENQVIPVSSFRLPA